MSGFRVVDSDGTVTQFETDGWESTTEAPSVAETLAERVDGPDEPAAVVAAETRGLVAPDVQVEVADLESGEYHVHNWTGQRVSLPAGSYLVRILAPVRTFVRVDGPVRVSRSGLEHVTVEFGEPTPVSVGFEPSVDEPTGTVTVPRTVEGVAAAVETFAAGAELTTPDRSWPSVRDPAPRVAFGSETTVSPSVTERLDDDTGVTLTLPRDLQTVLTSTTLAYYLGAAVEVVDGATPRLDLDGRSVSLGPSGPVSTHDDVTHPGGATGYASRAARVLETAFFGDHLVRGVGPYGPPVSAATKLSRVGIDPERLYDAPLAQRVARYLDAPLAPLVTELPDWHLSVSVAPRYESLEVLARTVHRLPAPVPPRGRTLSTAEVVDGDWECRRPRTDGGHCVDEPGGAGDPPRPLPSRRIAAAHDCGTVHGWSGPGQPVTAFDAVPAGFRNRDRYADGAETLSVLAVSSGVDEHAELERAVSHYDRRSEDLGLAVTTLTDPTVGELARALERGTDLLHFVGHREPTGLACADGVFSPTTLRESNARTFFLNTCDSYEDGVTLVERGSVAGVVTCRDVLDGMAAGVGATFARLLASGFSVAGATQTARHEALVDPDYLAVGDGTHVVSQSDDILPSRYEVTRPDDDRYTVTARNFSPGCAGAQVVHARIDADDGPRLNGQRRRHEMDRDAFETFLDDNSGPYLYRGRVLWTEEARDRLL
ncbi:hypothetical protein [Halobaculum sp. MBLA0143]|uniref:hypothetical protein n=1 Tax=Halobaculum sp. MBLA0143 TaxID=3079933 RepID=UPI00352571EC